ncbi:putative Tyrosine phosphatase family [Trypanosoma vivax]|uniref:protein-tyrosine-phosphatase n=1 Tax=Trypanosoma vivax (strain Y486) TaxID=1055687 RepID=G0U9S6_TRYVY|nr:putative tyrosine phosphatase [Trypanosoma vivax]KAH8618979.1 putative Tyrosine phosphatase family [Trypanosoma vivax]CCC52557.1 putative tyrosine phosphatase [Trypanosoma vivax Y486]
MIVPPNFGYVEERIYRCGAPEPCHYSFLSSLKLRTCVLLTDSHDEAFLCWLQENGIRTMSPVLCRKGLNSLYDEVNGMSYHGGNMTLSEPVVVGILHELIDPINYPLLLTCSMGRYRTGIVCGCLRKLQGWNLVSILEEYRRYAQDKSRADNEEFIGLFDKDLVSLKLKDGRKPTILYLTGA